MSEKIDTVINNFIVKNDFKEEQLADMISQINGFCVITGEGYVKIEKDSLSTKDKIFLILGARYLGNAYQKLKLIDLTIKDIVTSAEVSDMLKVDTMVINARLNDLKKEGKIKSIERGSYIVDSYELKKYLQSKEKVNN